MHSQSSRKGSVRRKRFSLLIPILLALVVCLNGSPTIAQGPGDGPIAVTIIGASGIEWQPQVDHAGLTLTISGPDGLTCRQEFEPGSVPTFGPVGPEGQRHPDGTYTYELLAVPVVDAETRAALMAARESGDSAAVVAQLQQAGKLPQHALVQSGHFTIRDGAIVTGDVSEPQTIRSPLAPLDVLHYDDVIITGSLCTGFDCQDGESFGYCTVKLKENNLQICFEDTSVGSFPTNDWKIQINDTTSGGASYFTIWDTDGGVRPFTIEAGTPAHSLYVEDYGRVGLGTSVPYVELHIVDGDTPTVRLDQDGSSGWTAQAWEMAGNETNFFIRDVTNGSKLPLRIQPSTPSNSLCLKATGYVGFGTWSPAYPMELETTGQDAAFVAERTDGAVAKISGDETKVTVGSHTSHPLELIVGDTTRMTIDSDGNVGIGTDSPTEKLHIASGGIKFPDGSVQTSAAGAGLWSSSGSDVYRSTGNVGIGTTAPGYPLEVERTGSDATFMAERTDGATAKFSAGGSEVQLGSVTNHDLEFVVNDSPVATLNAGGNLTLAGALIELSDASAKENLAAVNGQDVLARLADVPITTWNYIADDGTVRHMGPMAQDFYAAFALGPDERHIAPLDANGVALAAAQELYRIVQAQDAQIAQLEQQNADLEARVAALEALVEALLQTQQE